MKNKLIIEKMLVQLSLRLVRLEARVDALQAATETRSAVRTYAFTWEPTSSAKKKQPSRQSPKKRSS